MLSANVKIKNVNSQGRVLSPVRHCRNERSNTEIMDWLKVKICTSTEGIEPVCAFLYDMGITGLEISDKEDFAEFLENNRKYWDYVDETLEKLKEAETFITLYLTPDIDGKETLSHINSAVLNLKNSDESGKLGNLRVEVENVKDEDWSENWKKYFKPIEVGEKILIVPEWENDDIQTNRLKFIVNPGMSFGTGSHQSTQMCIEELEKYISSDTDMLDLGCGSGILSIISLILGAKSADAVDIDENAVGVAYSNLDLNGISKDKYDVMAGDVITDKGLRKKFSDKKYEVVVANIVADVIIAISRFIREFMKENGVFICSGIILERLSEVENALKEAGFDIINVKEKGEWAAIVCK